MLQASFSTRPESRPAWYGAWSTYVQALSLGHGVDSAAIGNAGSSKDRILCCTPDISLSFGHAKQQIRLSYLAHVSDQLLVVDVSRGDGNQSRHVESFTHFMSCALGSHEQCKTTTLQNQQRRQKHTCNSPNIPIGSILKHVLKDVTLIFRSGSKGLI